MERLAKCQPLFFFRVLRTAVKKSILFRLNQYGKIDVRTAMRYNFVLAYLSRRCSGEAGLFFILHFDLLIDSTGRQAYLN